MIYSYSGPFCNITIHNNEIHKGGVQLKESSRTRLKYSVNQIIPLWPILQEIVALD